jgi:hypothetical protein
VPHHGEGEVADGGRQNGRREPWAEAGRDSVQYLRRSVRRAGTNVFTKVFIMPVTYYCMFSLPWSSIPLPLPSSSEFLNDASDDDFTCILDEQRADADLHAFWMSPFFCNVCVYPDCQHVTSNLHTQNTWSAISSVRSTAVKLLMLLFCLIPRGRLLGYRTQQLDHNTGRGNT